MKNWELIGYGKDAERVGDTYSAIDYYAEYLKRKPKSWNINYKLAKKYYDINDFSSAKILFKRAMEKSGKRFPNSIYYLAEILRIESKYDSAINLYTIYQEKMRKKARGNLLYHLAEIRIESCTYAANNILPKVDYKVKHLNTAINKAHMESSPIILNDSVFVYSALVADSVPILASGDTKTKLYHRFYKAILNNNTWFGGYNASIGPFFDFDSLNVVNGTFSDSQKWIYLTV